MMEYIVGLYKLNMLPESILLMEAEDPESARRWIPRPSNKARNSSAGSMLSRAFSRYHLLCFASVVYNNALLCGLDVFLAAQNGPSITVRALCWPGIATSATLCCAVMALATCSSLSVQHNSDRKAIQRTVSCRVERIFAETVGVLLCSLISLEGADSGPPGEGSAREMEATQRTVSCMSACRVEDIFADSKFLRAESLHELVKAIMWASGPIKRVASSGEESDTAQVFSATPCPDCGCCC